MEKKAKEIQKNVVGFLLNQHHVESINDPLVIDFFHIFLSACM